MFGLRQLKIRKKQIDNDTVPYLIKHKEENKKLGEKDADCRF